MELRRDSAASRPREESSTVGGRYRLGRKFAAGGMSVVHEAEHLVTGARVAMKIAAVDPDNATELHARMMREARTLGAIRHDHVVTIHDAGELADGRVYLALELLDGRALDTILGSRGHLPPLHVAWIGMQLADALFATHVSGVLHRDVKPSNAMVVRTPSGDETVKLFDFGIAGPRTPRHGSKPRAHRLTARDILVGTPEYIAPERFEHDTGDDERSDIYSLGITLYELLAGDVPFTGSYGEILIAAATKAPRPLTELGVPPALAAVVHKAMARDRDARFTSARAVATALAPFALGPRAPLLPVAVADVDLDDADVELVAEEPARPPPLPGARRRHPRAVFHAAVRVLHDGGETVGHAEDLSEGGMLVSAPRQLGKDLSAKVRFRPPGLDHDVELIAAVRWSKEGRHGAALGVEFTSLPADVRRAIAAYVARAAPAA